MVITLDTVPTVVKRLADTSNFGMGTPVIIRRTIVNMIIDTSVGPDSATTNTSSTVSFDSATNTLTFDLSSLQNVDAYAISPTSSATINLTNITIDNIVFLYDPLSLNSFRHFYLTMASTSGSTDISRADVFVRSVNEAENFNIEVATRLETLANGDKYLIQLPVYQAAQEDDVSSAGSVGFFDQMHPRSTTIRRGVFTWRAI